MNNWIKMIKGEEEKLVHPGNVGNHKRFGWKVPGEAEEIAAQEGTVDYSVPVKMTKGDQEKTVPSGQVSNYEKFSWVASDSVDVKGPLDGLTEDQLIAKAQAATSFEDLKDFEEREDFSQAVLDTLTAKVKELYETELTPPDATLPTPNADSTTDPSTDDSKAVG